MEHLLGFLVAVTLTMALIPPLARHAGRLGLVDRPDPRKVHQVPVPRVGGVAMAVGLLAGVLLWVPVRQDVAAYLAGALVLIVAGVVDDRGDLDYRWKFLAQFVAVGIAIAGGDILVQRMVFCGDAATPCSQFWQHYLAVPFTVLAMVGVTNAVNLSDGLDGLAAGTMLMAVAALGLLAYEGGDQTAVLLALVLSGTLFGFLRFNTHPAQVFMGDTGSQLLGYSAAVLAVVVSQSSNPAISPAVPLVILALPVADTLAVMARRVLSGLSPFRADRSHLHHRLLRLGLDHYEVVFAIYLGQGALVVLALLLRYHGDGVVLGTVAGVVGAVVAGLWLAERRAWQVARPGEGATQVGRMVHYLRREAVVIRFASGLLTLLTPAVFLAVVLAAPAPRDVAFAALAVLVLTAGGWLTRRGTRVFRVSLYMAAALVAYLSEGPLGGVAQLSPLLDGAFVALAVAIALLLRLARGGFTVTTLDFLVVFVALLLPPTMDGLLPGVDMGAFVLKFIILCYAAELAYTQGDWGPRALGVASVASGLVVGVQAF